MDWSCQRSRRAAARFVTTAIALHRVGVSETITPAFGDKLTRPVATSVHHVECGSPDRVSESVTCKIRSLDQSLEIAFWDTYNGHPIDIDHLVCTLVAETWVTHAHLSSTLHYSDQTITESPHPTQIGLYQNLEKLVKYIQTSAAWGNIYMNKTARIFPVSVNVNSSQRG